MLFGLAAAAIPLVLHLLTLRRLRTIEFSTLEFLKELQRSRIRRLRIRQWLLLLLRTLLVMLLVLAFGRPTLQGTLPEAWGAAARTTALILLDDSYSMTVVDDRGERARQAREAAEGIIRSLREGDEVNVLPFSSSQPMPLTAMHAVALDEAKHVRSSAVRRPLDAALQTAGEILSTARSANRELFVVSDLQRTLLERSTAGPIATLQDPAIHCFVVPIGNEAVTNTSLTSMRFGSTLVDLGSPFSVKAVLAERSEIAASGTTVSLFFGTDRVDQRALQLNPGAVADVSLAGVPNASGWLTGRLVVEGDDVEFDNSRSFVIRIRQEWSVLLVGNEADVRYLRLALQVRSDSAGARLRLDAVSPERLSESRWVGYDAYIVAVGHASMDRWAARLRSLAERGAGVVLLPGAGANAWGSIGETFGLGNAPAETAGSGSFIAFRSADLDHPIFDGMFEPSDLRARDSRRIPTPEIQRSLPMRVPPKGVAVVTLSTGQPFLVEMPVGQGRVVAFATAADAAWSDLPTQGLFVPLLHRSLAVAAGAQEIRPVVVTGSSVDLPVPPGARGSAQVLTPDRRTIPLTPASTPIGNVLRVGSVDMPGVYSVMMEGREVDRFAAVIDDRETDTRPATEEQRGSFFESIGLVADQWTILEPTSDMERTVQEARLGTELWRFFLLAALIVAIAESLVAARRTPIEERGTS
jgi:hypothetical protein